jgi:hypothetical protein
LYGTECTGTILPCSSGTLSSISTSILRTSVAGTFPTRTLCHLCMVQNVQAPYRHVAAVLSLVSVRVSYTHQ